MYSASGQASHSHFNSRAASQEHAPSQYPAAAALPAQPSISGKQQQEASPGAFAPQTIPPTTQAPDYLHPSHRRQRSSSLGRPQPSGDTTDLKRSHSLNENMSNPQAGYYQMASPIAGYQQQLYGQSAMSQSGYYQGLPQSTVPLSTGYGMDARPGMQSMDYYQSMPYNQSTYPASYASSYASSASGMAPPYGSPMASQQFPRPTQPALPGAPPVQVVDRAKKPQCWEHGCNGREFSTFSNLLRHQREKSGTAAKSYCPHCGAEFTRTTARNGHMEHGKCKTRRATGSAS